MKARAELLSALVQHVKSWGISQEAAAARLGVTRPRLNDLMRGKLGKFSLDALVNLDYGGGTRTRNSGQSRRLTRFCVTRAKFRALL